MDSSFPFSVSQSLHCVHPLLGGQNIPHTQLYSLIQYLVCNGATCSNEKTMIRRIISWRLAFMKSVRVQHYPGRLPIRRVNNLYSKKIFRSRHYTHLLKARSQKNNIHQTLASRNLTKKLKDSTLRTHARTHGR